MAGNNIKQVDNTDLCSLIEDIKNGKVLLPDFQRPFEWTDEESQKKLIASVIAKLPIGSILLLDGPADDYCCKEIGRNVDYDTKNCSCDKVSLVLDGQQRLTVLTSVFSNVIQRKGKVSEFVSTKSLKRRFFLTVPKWKYNEKDLLLGSDCFDASCLDKKAEPSFLSADVYDRIVSFSYNTGDNNSYNPEKDFTSELDAFCVNINEHQGNYLIPLFLLSPQTDDNRYAVEQRFKYILKEIQERIAKQIEDHFNSLTSQNSSNEKLEFIQNIFIKRPEIIDDLTKCNKNDSKSFQMEFKTKLNEVGEQWAGKVVEYLTSCVEDLYLNRISVDSSSRERAIDIYENLNKGGVCLSTFDLIIARVAKVSRESLTKIIINNIKHNNKDKKSGSYKNLVEKIYSKYFDKNNIKDYNASLSMGCLDGDGKISKKFLDSFLVIMSLYINKKDQKEKYLLEFTKRKEILRLDPQSIKNNTEKVCIAIERALFFFQSHCGIRKINDINYALMIVLVATLFIEDSVFTEAKNHSILEAWYWISVFSGKYDKDQNIQMISDLNKLSEILSSKKTKDVSYLRTGIAKILNFPDFSDLDCLLMKNKDRLPKNVLRDFICQYFLSRSYQDMFDNNLSLSAFMEEKQDTKLEAHHIIPLGSIQDACTYEQSTEKLRKDTSNICNSPLNFVYITSAANKKISKDDYNTYIKKISDTAKSALRLDNFKDVECKTGINLEKFFETRHQLVQGDIKKRVEDLLNSI